MNTGVRYVDDLKPISDDDVFRVRSVPGVAWAVNLYRGAGQAQLANGTYQGVILMGLDDASLTGAPTHMLKGKIGDLQIPDAILVDEAGFHQMWPGEPMTTGKVIEMNQRRAVVVGIYRASQTFMTMPIIYTRFSQATLFVPPTPTGRLSPFVLAKAKPGVDPEVLARRIQTQTELKALTNEGFMQLTMYYYLGHTGIPLNFGTTVILAFLVGSAIAGQTFYLFTVENLKQFGTLKAMGMSDRRVVGMILIQGAVVGSIGYGVGVGLATVYGIFAQGAMPLLAFFLPWQVLLLTGAAMIVIVVLASLLSIRRVLVLEPAVVFQGGT
jgi:putative ABC transport system permease protein